MPKLLVFNRRIDCLLLPTVLVQSHWYAVVDLVLEFFVFGDLEKLVFDAFVFQLYNLSLQPFRHLLLFIRRWESRRLLGVGLLRALVDWFLVCEVICVQLYGLPLHILLDIELVFEHDEIKHALLAGVLDTVVALIQLLAYRTHYIN